jgi:hypothetical protein
MSVIDFPQRAPRHDGWQPDELRQLAALFETNPWDVGATEQGEPQFYVLGQAPDHPCVLCVSRLAHGYVLEDGIGRVVCEAPALHLFAERAARAVAGAARSFIARATLLICAVRLAIEEKLEPIFEEAQDSLTRFAPQLAGFV